MTRDDGNRGKERAVVDEFGAARPQRGTLRWGHYGPELLCLSVLGVIATGMYPLPGVAGAAMPGLLLGFVVATWLAMRHHDRSLCEHCLAALPLNAAEVAARFGRRFWLTHNLSRRELLIPYLVVLIGTNFAIGTTLGRLIWAIAQSSMIYLIVCYATHRRLQPWCPWCSGGDGGSDRDDVPGPNPDRFRQPV